MSPSELSKHASELEINESKCISCNPDLVKILEPMLLGIYCLLQPAPSDYENRKLIIKVFSEIVRGIYGSNNGFPVLEAFGSFMMDIFTAASDLDLSMNFSDDKVSIFPRSKKIAVLRRLAKTLYALQSQGRVSTVSPIFQARIPIVKVVDRGTGIECDISIENKDGISRSLFLSIVSSIDERFRILSHLMKLWAKVHNINSSRDRTMNSLTIVSLVAFHLQTRTPPILPPFSTLFKDGTDMSRVQYIILGLKDFGKMNDESVTVLFRTLLSKLSSVEHLWELGLCASTYEGSWIDMTSEMRSKHVMTVEDFLDRSENFARAVGKAEIHKIYSCIRSSLRHIELFQMGQISIALLKELLFGFVLSDGKNIKDNEKVNPKRKSLDSGVLEQGRVKPSETVDPQEPIANVSAQNTVITKRLKLSANVSTQDTGTSNTLKLVKKKKKKKNKNKWVPDTDAAKPSMLKLDNKSVPGTDAAEPSTSKPDNKKSAPDTRATHEAELLANMSAQRAQVRGNSAMLTSTWTSPSLRPHSVHHPPHNSHGAYNMWNQHAPWPHLNYGPWVFQPQHHHTLPFFIPRLPLLPPLVPHLDYGYHGPASAQMLNRPSHEKLQLGYGARHLAPPAQMSNLPSHSNSQPGRYQAPPVQMRNLPRPWNPTE